MDADGEMVSWRDRDWAQFTDEERGRLFGGSGAGSRQLTLRPVIWCLVGVAALAVVAMTYVVRMPGLIPTNSLGAGAPTNTHVVYGGPTWFNTRLHQHLACTEQSANFEKHVWFCTTWTILQPGQVVQPAADLSGRCKVRHVEQQAGRWICDVPLPPLGPNV